MRRALSVLLVLILLMTFGISSYAENDSSFKIAFLDVGEGDSSIITCDGYTMMIDGGPSDKSDYIYTYLKNNSIDRIDYMVASHPDADHIGGLSGALNYAEVGTVLCPVTENNTKQFESFVKYLNRQKNHIIVPNAGDRFSLGTAEVEVLYPNRGESTGDNTSLVLKITYGDTAFLFMGDNELSDEEKLLDTKADLSSTVLKIGHHGSSSSTGELFLKCVNPKHAVMSVGSDNVYGHPTDEITRKLTDSNIQLYRTDENGIVVCTSDGKEVSFSVEKKLVEQKKFVPFAADEDEETGDSKDADSGTRSITNDYIANTNTKKFHVPSCNSVKKMKETNKWYFSGTREELIQNGYTPCKICNP